MLNQARSMYMFHDEPCSTLKSYNISRYTGLNRTFVTGCLDLFNFRILYHLTWEYFYEYLSSRIFLHFCVWNI